MAGWTGRERNIRESRERPPGDSYLPAQQLHRPADGASIPGTAHRLSNLYVFAAGRPKGSRSRRANQSGRARGLASREFPSPSPDSSHTASTRVAVTSSRFGFHHAGSHPHGRPLLSLPLPLPPIGEGRGRKVTPSTRREGSPSRIGLDS